MSSNTTTLPKKLMWPGRVISGIPIWFLLIDSMIKLFKPARLSYAAAKLGYSESIMTGLGIFLLICIIVHVIPRTAIVGAIVLTGYLGGVTAINLRIGDPLFQIFLPCFLGLLIWGGLYLRDDRLRALIPLRKPQALSSPEALSTPNFVS